MATKPPPTGWLWTEDAANYLGVHFTTLYRWRRDDTGPAFKRHGQRRYAYKISTLNAWMEGDPAATNQPARAAA